MTPASDVSHHSGAGEPCPRLQHSCDPADAGSEQEAQWGGVQRGSVEVEGFVSCIVVPPGSSATLAGRCLAGDFAGRDGGAGGGGTLRAQLCHSLAAAFPAVAAHAGDLAERQL